MFYKPDWLETKKRFEAFWKGEILDRCMIAVTTMTNPQLARMAYPINWYDRSKTEEEILDYWLSPERVLQRNIQKFENTFVLGRCDPSGVF